MPFVAVAVERAGDRCYTYAVADGIGAGAVLRVPFRQEVRLGIAVGEAQPTDAARIRPALEHLGDLPGDLLRAVVFLHEEGMADWGSIAQAVLPPTVAVRELRWYALPEGRVPKVRGSRRALVLAALADGPRRADELPASPAELERLARSGLIRPVPPPPCQPLCGEHTLSVAQREAVERLLQPGVHLLEGVTGSGKTEVYLECARRVIEDGHGAVVLVPEIALTAQMISLFRARFGHLLVLQHSRLAAGERAAAFLRLLRGEARLVLGARSAILAPVRNLRLVVLDEEHEPSYQQDEAPRYHTRQLAEVRCGMDGSVVLGSATPDLVTRYRARTGAIGHVVLQQRFGAGAAQVELVDLRGERGGLLSPRLLEALEPLRRQGKQAILFLNRRGYARTVLCMDCGFGFPCPHCTVSLVYHQEERSLTCHYCNHRQGAPSVCPRCGSGRLKALGYGTERLDEELKARLPGLRVLRLDQDAVRRRGSHERILTAFRQHEADVLVGTQMVAKGLHFPDVAVAAVVLADTTLRLPDFRAAERTFQLVAQVVGRTGRGNDPGRVLVQTFLPEHHAMQTALRQDVEAFYQLELRARREAHYPPFCHLLLFGFSGPEEEPVQAAARRRAETLAALGLRPLGPAPALIRRVRDQYRWQVLVKLPTWQAMVEVAARLRGHPRAGVREAVLLDPMTLL